MPAAVIEEFPGLDLRADPGDASGAIDLLNVTLEQGRVRTRDGSSSFCATTGTAWFLARFARAAGEQMIVGDLAGLTAFSAAGASLGNVATPLATQAGMTGVAVGTATDSYFYASDLVTAGGIRRWDGTTWTSPAAFAASAAVSALAVTPSDNRLALCVGSAVRFSGAGLPESYAANDFVILTPGDGESIQGAVTFNNQMFVFKKTKFFVFYGQSTDSTGQPIFNYRAVDTGIGMQIAAPQSVCVGRDGVYFIGSDGIYRTTGGPPVKISHPIEPFFEGDVSPFWALGVRWRGDAVMQRIAWANGKLYVALAYLSNGFSGLTFVFDPELNAWSAWDRFGTMVEFAHTSSFSDPLTRGLYIGPQAGGVHMIDRTSTTDAGTDIVSRYRSPFHDFGSSQGKVIRETVLEGKGTPTFKWSRDWGILDTGSAVTLGTSPAIAKGRQRLAVRGRHFSWQAGAASGAWALNRIKPILLNAQRPDGIV